MSTDGLPRFSGNEMQRRHEGAFRLCEQHGVDALLVYGHSGARRHYQADIHYLTEVAPYHDAYVLVQPMRSPVLWVSHNNHLASNREVACIEDVRRVPRAPAAALASELDARGLRASRVGLVGSWPYQTVDALRGELPDVRWQDLSLPFRQLRVLKSEEELEFQRRAAAGCDRVMSALRQAIRPGVEERELLVLAEHVAWEDGCTPNFLYLNSTPMATSSSCVPNQHLSRRKLQMGDVVNTELTVSYGMYSAQLLRPFFLGEPTRTYAHLYSTLKSVHDSLAAAMRAGTPLQVLHEISLEFKRQGFTTVDSLLHGFGVDILPPSVMYGFLPAPDGATLQAGTTVVLQPNPTTPDEKAGMQLGEMGLITDSAFVSMHASPAEVTFCA